MEADASAGRRGAHGRGRDRASRARRRRPARPRRSASASCPSARVRSARSTRRTRQACTPPCRSTRARSPRIRTILARASRAARSRGHPIKIVAVGCGSDQADLAIKETRRIIEQNKADVMIGPLSGDESVAIAKYAKAAPDEDLRRRLGRRAGHDPQGACTELLPLQRRRCAVERRSRRPRVQQARLEDGSGHPGQLQLRLDVGGRLHRRVLRRRRQRGAAGQPAAQHDRLLDLRPAAQDRRRRHVRRGRRLGPDPVPEGLRAGARPDRRARSSSATCSGARRACSRASRPRSPARTSAAPAPRAISTPPRRKNYANKIIGKWFKKIPPGGAAAPQAA